MSEALRYYLKRARELKPHEIAFRIKDRLAHRIASNIKKRHYSKNWGVSNTSVPVFVLSPFISLDQLPHLELPHEYIHSIGTRYCEHKFDFLGSDWSCVSRSEHLLAGEHFETGNWLKEVLDSDHETKAREIWLSGAHLRRVSNQNTSYTPIDWQLDPRSGQSFSAKYWFGDPRLRPSPGRDVKLPNELSRLQHLPQLALFYRETGEQRYFLECLNQLIDFIATNPPGMGVNWRCAMEVAIRLANIVITFDMLRQIDKNDLITPLIESIIAESIFQHCAFIYSNLERYGEYRNNHYLADIVGLLFGAASLARSQLSENWLEFGLRELASELDFHIQDDGTLKEGSTYYHALVTEMVVYGSAVAIGSSGNGDIFIQKLWTKLNLAISFLADLKGIDGTLPAIGDDDSGKFFKFQPCYSGDPADLEENPRDITPVLRGAKGFISDNFGIESGIVSQLRKGIEAGHADLAVSIEEDSIVRYYKDFGLIRYKSNHCKMTVRCDENILPEESGHFHQDQLSITLALYDEELFIDPGTLVYTSDPATRNRYRSSQFHSSLIDTALDEEAVSCSAQHLFRLFARPRAEVLEVNSSKIRCKMINSRGEFERAIGFSSSEPKVVGLDSFGWTGVKQLQFLLPGNLLLKQDASNVVSIGSESRNFVFKSEQGKISLKPSERARGYGRVAECTSMVLETEAAYVSWSVSDSSHKS